jgi:hypothetical protein
MTNNTIDNVQINVEDAVRRANKRSREVPEEFIREVFDTLSKNKQYYKSHFHFFHEIPNSDGELTDKVILSAYKSVSNFFKSPSI